MPVTFENIKVEGSARLVSGVRGSGDRARRTASAEWSVDIIEVGKLRPVPGVEVINLVLVEDKAAITSVCRLIG